MTTAIVEIKNDSVEAPCLPQGRDTRLLGPFLTWPPAPSPQPPHPCCAGHSSCPGQEGSTFSGHFLFFVWGCARRGQLYRSRRRRKKGRKEIPTSCQERLSLANAMPPPWVLEKTGTVGVGEAVTLCLLSPEHHPTYVLKSQVPSTSDLHVTLCRTPRCLGPPF